MVVTIMDVSLGKNYHNTFAIRSEVRTPPTPPLAWSTEPPLPTSKHVNTYE